SFRVPQDRVNTVRITAEFVDKERMPHEISEQKLTGPFGKEPGLAWSYPLPKLQDVSDSTATPKRSIAELMENGRPIGVPHSEHLKIQRQGGGLFSHWHDYLYFSTSDNSDPNKNGRQYTIRMTKVPEDARRIRVTFRKAP